MSYLWGARPRLGWRATTRLAIVMRSVITVIVVVVTNAMVRTANVSGGSGEHVYGGNGCLAGFTRSVGVEWATSPRDHRMETRELRNGGESRKRLWVSDLAVAFIVQLEGIQVTHIDTRDRVINICAI